LYGGFIFGLYNKNGIDLTTWEYLAFRIRSTKDFDGVIVKLQKPGDIGVFYAHAELEGKANIWHDVKIELVDIVPAPDNNPSLFIIMPSGGDDIHARFCFDDLMFIRPKLIPVSDIVFDEKQLQLRKGDILQLNHTFLPGNATNINLARWKSSNEKVVLVSSKGLIAVVGKGETIVSVDVAGVESSIKIISK
jgi:hypothetical protein